MKNKLMKEIESNRRQISDLEDKIMLICPHKKVIEDVTIFYNYKCTVCGKKMNKSGIPKGATICEMTCRKNKVKK